MTMNGTGGKKTEKEIMPTGQRKEGQSDKKGGDNGIEHIRGVEDLSRGKSSNQSQEEAKFLVPKGFADEEKEQGDNGGKESETNPGTGIERQDNSKKHNQPVVNGAKVKWSGRRG